MMGLLTLMTDYIDQRNFNLLIFIFMGFTTIAVVFGSLMNSIEKRLPVAIRQTYRYGKHSLKGPERAEELSFTEVPKSWFKHFYVFAAVWAFIALFLILKGFVFHTEAPECVLVFLDFFGGGRNNRKVKVNSSQALLATVLLTLQCGRRFYETNFVQIFSKKSKINFSHYIVGYIHYFGAVLALLANTEGFVRGTAPTPFSFLKVSFVHYLCIFIFHFAWTQQYKSNMILVNLRKDDKTNQVVTEGHLLPTGGFFNFVSSPHMFFEVIMYFMLFNLMHTITWGWITIWVMSNQITNALLTHEWYKENFKNYPKNRKAIIPFVW